MKTNQEYKNAALAALSGNWAPAVVASVVMMLIVVATASPSVLYNMSLFDASVAAMLKGVSLPILWGAGTLLGIFVISPVGVGTMYTFNRLLVSGDNDLTGNLLKGSLQGYGRNVWGMFLLSLYVTLWSLLLIVPGIIKSFSYAMTPYILKDNPELSANQAIDLSRKMMRGHKFDLFWLYLSFIGWYFLGIFTFGIGYFWLMPYLYTAQAAFYQDLKKEYATNKS